MTDLNLHVAINTLAGSDYIYKLKKMVRIGGKLTNYKRNIKISA